MNISKKVALIIMDGFGISPSKDGNAVFNAKTPNFDNIINSYPTTLLSASGQEIGLEFGEIGNSEVGHLNIGTGRVIIQNLPRINQSIKNKTFFNNMEINDACDFVNSNKSTLHLVGLVSNGGIHSHINHLIALLDFAKAKNVNNVAIHVITDGRDTRPKVALEFIKILEAKIINLKNFNISSICGRFYAMDRDKHWKDRTKLYFDLIINGNGEKFKNSEEAIISSYNKGENDENIKPKIIYKNVIKNNDAIISFNYRIDRIKQLSESIIDPDFKEFKRIKYLNNLMFVSFTNYGFEPTKMVKIAFFTEKIKNSLAEVLSKHNLPHLHVAETEKYAHITYFFNGGEEKPFEKEKRCLVPSSRVKSYDEKPEMSAKIVTDKFLYYFNKFKPVFSVVNFANADMVGHTGNYQATIKAVESVDESVGRIIEKLMTDNVEIIVTADHGNAEEMIVPESNEINKEHTTNPVPFVIISDKKQDSDNTKESISLMQPVAVLADVSPTILNIIGVELPNEMNGQNIKDLI